MFSHDLFVVSVACVVGLPAVWLAGVISVILGRGWMAGVLLAAIFRLLACDIAANLLRRQKGLISPRLERPSLAVPPVARAA